MTKRQSNLIHWLIDFINFFYLSHEKRNLLLLFSSLIHFIDFKKSMELKDLSFKQISSYRHELVMQAVYSQYNLMFWTLMWLVLIPYEQKMPISENNRH